MGVTAYAIVQRVPSAPPRLRRTCTDAAHDAADLAAQPPPVASVSLPQLEADDPDTLADRIAALRTGLAQATWYLFSPEGWR